MKSVLLASLLCLARSSLGQPARPEGDDLDPLRRITLEDALAVDPSDLFLGADVPDRDPVDDLAGSTLASVRLSRSSVTIGYAGRAEDVERGWTGSTDRAVVRADLRILPHVDIGFTGEKDAGEPWDLGFTSAYATFRGLPLGAECILGDFRVRDRCGLVIGGGPPPMGFEDALRRVEEERPDLTPHRSRDEIGFLRGAGVSVPLAGRPASHFVLFVSRRKFPSSDGGTKVSTGSLFRTEAEIRKKDRICESVVGGRFVLDWGGVVSCSLMLLRFRLDPAGECASIAGLDFSAQSGPIRLMGELALSEGGGMAAVVMGAVVVDRLAAVTLTFQSLSARMANHRLESVLTSAKSNETSCRLSARCSFSASTRIEGHLRQRWTPSIAQSKLSRSEGWSGGFGGTAGLRRGWVLHVSYRARRGDDERVADFPDGWSRRIRVFTGSEAARVALQCSIGSTMESRTAFQIARTSDIASGAEERGEHLRQEFSWRPWSQLEISLSGTVFSSDAYTACTRTLEDDAIARLQYEPLVGDGFHWSAAITVSPPGTGLTLLALISASEQSHRPWIGHVPRRGEWGVRLRWAG